MKRNRPFYTISISGRLALALSMTALLNGCGRESDEAAALRQARQDLEYLASYHGTAPDGKSISYDKIVSNLSKVSSSSVQGEADAAHLLRAEASARSGNLIAGRITSVERDALRSIVTIQNTLNHWRLLGDSATSLTSYDPKSLIDDLNKQATERDAEIATISAELKTAEAALAQLEAQAKEAQEKAQSERTREANFRTQAIDKSQTQRAELIEQANAASRTGDGFEKTASELLAEAGKQRPGVEETRRRLDSARSQRALIDLSKTEIERLARVSADQSKKTVDGDKIAGGADRVGVKQLQEQLLAQVAALEQLRDKGAGEGSEPLDEMYDKAQQQFSTASSEAGKVKGSGGKSGATTLAIAGYKQGLADLLMAKARGLEAYAGIMQTLATTQPALPGDFGKKAADAKAAYEKTLTEAQAAYTDSRGNFESTGSREQVERVKLRIESIAATLATFDPSSPVTPPTPNENADGATPTAPVDGTPTAEGTPKPTPEETRPVATDAMSAEVIAAAQILTADVKKGDLQAFSEHVLFRNEKQKEYFAKLIPMRSKTLELSKACKEAFGKGFTPLSKEFMANQGALGGGTQVTQEELLLDYLLHAEPSDMSVSPSPDNEDQALVSSVSGEIKEPMRFAKRDGTWKLMLDIPPSPIEFKESFMQAFNVAMDNAIGGIKSGKYGTDSAAMFKELYEALTKAFLESVIPEDK